MLTSRVRQTLVCRFLSESSASVEAYANNDKLKFVGHFGQSLTAEQAF
jgi:hypothetical protein